MGASDQDREILRSFAQRINPSDAGAHNNLGALYFQQDMVDEAVEQFSRMPRVLRGDHVHFLQDTHCPQGDVLEVADRRGDYVESTDVHELNSLPRMNAKVRE